MPCIRRSDKHVSARCPILTLLSLHPCRVHACICRWIPVFRPVKQQRMVCRRLWRCELGYSKAIDGKLTDLRFFSACSAWSTRSITIFIGDLRYFGEHERPRFTIRWIPCGWVAGAHPSLRGADRCVDASLSVADSYVVWVGLNMQNQ